MARQSSHRCRWSAARSQQGAATLVVVMSLFFVISMVAAYASRNLIFEQRTSANQYRSTQAFEAAEAGIEWALALLNGGRIDAGCQPTGDAAFNSFRARYLAVDGADGSYTPRTGGGGSATESLRAGCVRNAVGWNCSCATDGVPVLAAPDGSGAFPAFRVHFEPTGRPGLVRIASTGCTTLNDTCLARGIGSAGDASATISALFGLARALHMAPVAAVTVRGDLDVGGFALHVVNTDAATNGIAIDAGGTVTAPNAVLESVAGAPGLGTVIDGDRSLNALSADRMFVTFFGIDRNTFKRQPAAVRITCEAGGCATRLREAVESHPGRPIWISGDLGIEQNLVLGTAADPVLLVVGGSIHLATPGTRIFGLVYSQAVDGAIGGAGIVQGALMAEGHLTGSSAPAVVYDAEVIQRLQLTTGSMIRVPGGWRDF